MLIENLRSEEVTVIQSKGTLKGFQESLTSIVSWLAQYVTLLLLVLASNRPLRNNPDIVFFVATCIYMMFTKAKHFLLD